MNLHNLYLVDSNEFNLFKLKIEINKIKFNCKIHFLLLDVSEDYSIKELSKFKIDQIIHVAAYKHVDLLEQNPIPAIKNNIFSTFKLCQLAKVGNIKKFLLISSDKAVNPKNLMGKTKRYNEIIVESFNYIYSKTLFSSVRFGNVLNSSGSVIPIFIRQIQNNLPITITSKKATRYFMSISEAVSLILLTLTMIKPKKIFIFNMGKKIKIFEIARRILSINGYKISKNPKNQNEYKYIIIGMKKGEKIHERLHNQGKLKKTKYKKILETKNDTKFSIQKINKQMNEFKTLIDNNDKELISKKLSKFIKLTNV